MPRKSLVHYIAPSAISATPNCNDSPHDLAVSLVRGAKIKVYSPDAGLGTEDGYFQEWTLYGRNRRLTDGRDGYHRYTIYARLPKANKDGGYLVFAQMTKDEYDEWQDKYAYITTRGLSDTGAWSDDYWYVRLGEVSEPVGGKRTVTLDTGLLGTDQFNTEWNVVQEGLYVDLSCQLMPSYDPEEGWEPDGEDAGPTPYVPWGYWLRMQASLGGLREDETVDVVRWEITRSTGAGPVDWLPDGDTRKEYFRENGSIILSHTRGDGGTDDFAGAVSTVFTVTAKGKRRDGGSDGDEEEPVVVQDGEGGEEEELEVLATALITIMSETTEQYGLSLSDTIVNYDDENGFTPEKVFVHVRSTDQKSGVTYVTAAQIQAARLLAQYSYETDDAGQEIWNTLAFADNQKGVGEAFVGNDEETHRADFYEGKNIVVRLVETEIQDDGEGGQTPVVVKELARQTILNYYNLDAKYVTVGFFRKLFAVHHIDDEGYDALIETNNFIDPDDETVNIEAKRGFWSPSYVSALGQGSNPGGGGGGGGGDALEWPLLQINNAGLSTSPSAGDVIVYDPNASSRFRWGKAGLSEQEITTLCDRYYLRLASGTKQAVTSDIDLMGDLQILRSPISDFTGKDNYVLTLGETEAYFGSRYVTVEFFESLFKVYNGTATSANQIATNGTIPSPSANVNIKAMFGFWTEQYLSALGQGSGGGSGGGSGAALSQPLLSINQMEAVPAAAGQTLVWRGAGQGVNGSGWAFGTAGMDETALASYLSTHGYKNDTEIRAGYSWWGQRLNASNEVTGDITVGIGDIILNNERKIRWKKSTGDTSYSMLTIDGSNNFIVGEAATAANEIDTYVRGRAVYFQSASGSVDASLTLPTGESTPVFYVKKLKIGSITISEDTQNGGLHVENAGLYADTFLSALGAGSHGGSGGMDLDAMWNALGTNDTSHKIHNSHLNFDISNYALRTEIPSLNGYATESWVSSHFNNYEHPTGGANTTITAASGLVLSSITVNNLGHVTAVGSKTLAAADIPSLNASKITDGQFNTARIPNLDWSKITTGKPTTLSGYGITDAKISGGVITLGTNTITPLTDAKIKSDYTWGGAKLDSSGKREGDMTGVGSITMDGGITGCTGVDSLMYFFTADSNKQVKITSATSGSSLINPTEKGSYQRGSSTFYPRLFVNGNVGVTNELWVGGVDFAGASGHGGYLDFNYGGQYTNDYSTRIIESASGVLTVKRYSGATGLVVGTSTKNDYVKIGGATIYWDSDNQALHVDKGVYSDSFVSSLGMGSGGTGGGTLYGLQVVNTSLRLVPDGQQTSVDLSSAIGLYLSSSSYVTGLTVNGLSTGITVSNHTINIDNVVRKVKVNGTEYSPYQSGMVDLGTISGGGVTLDTDQTITGVKTNSNGSKFKTICIECSESSDGTGAADSSRGGEINRYDGHLWLQYDSAAKDVVLSYGSNSHTCIGVAPSTTTQQYKLYVNGHVRATSLEAACFGGPRTDTWQEPEGVTPRKNRLWYGYDRIDADSTHDNSWHTTFSDYFGMTFHTRDGWLCMTQTGNVGIGTTSPSYRLHVDGDAYASKFVKSGGTSSQFLKADGSVDSNTYLTGGDVVTLANAQTISGEKTFSSKVIVSSSGIEMSDGTRIRVNNGHLTHYKNSAHVNVIDAEIAMNYCLGMQSYDSTPSGATIIDTSVNVNNIKSAGTYCCKSAASITGQPARGNYRLWHIVNSGTDNSSSQNAVQVALYTSNAKMYLRSYVSGTFGDWNEVATTGNAVTLADTQTISGAKTFTSGVTANALSISSGGTLSVIGSASTLSVSATNISNYGSDLTIQGKDSNNNYKNLSLCSGGGNVGIGASAKSGYKLYVNGSAIINGTPNSSLNITPNLYVSGIAHVTNKLYIGLKEDSKTADAYMYRYVPTGSNIFLAVSAPTGMMVNGSVVQTSDIRMKDVVSMIENIGAEEIARAPIFDFTWKERTDKSVHLGTSAQYWQSILSHGVVDLGEAGLSLDYGATALAAAVMTARTVLTHEEKIAKLMSRVDAVEQENKAIKAENQWLRQEIELLKAA